MLARISLGYKVALAAAGLAMICFFLPWISVSAFGYTESVTGWQLATLFNAPLLLLVLLAGLGVGALAYLSYQHKSTVQLDGFGVIGAGALPLTVIALTLLTGNQVDPRLAGAAQLLGIGASLSIGAMGSIVGYIAVIVGGVLNLSLNKQPAYTPPAAMAGVSSFANTPVQPPMSAPVYMPPPIQTPPPMPVANPSTTCQHCGSALRPGAKFCARCGTAQTAVAPLAPTPTVCPSCRAALRPEAKFCDRCGYAVR